MTDTAAALPYRQLWVDHGVHRIGVQVYRQPQPPAPAVVVWPAMGVPARFYRPFATALSEAGLAVSVADLRGTGASAPRPTRRSGYGYAELTADVGAVLTALREQLAGRRVVLVGHSLGGQACLLHLARTTDPRIDGLALVAVGIPYWRVYTERGRLGVWAFTQSIHAAATLLRVWPGWGFGGRQSRGVIRDWAYTARTGRFPALAGTAVEREVRRVRTPVLAISLERDQYTPASTVDHLVDKLTAAPVQREHFDGGADHFTWARCAGPVAERVAAFATTAGRTGIR